MFWGRVQSISLKGRIRLVFTGLMAVTLLISSLLLWEMHLMVTRAGEAPLQMEEFYRSIRLTVAILVGMFLLLYVAGHKIISVITEPLSSLVKFLDEVNVEDDLPSEVQGFNSPVHEVQHVARSFERLLGRLRGYRTLNVRRLLIEKRRADVIAASITDGVFLLRNEEILYVNPVGERILGGASLKSLAVDTHCNHPGPRAVRSAISQTIPVEYCLEDGDRKVHFLIQAYSLSSELIDQVDQFAPGSHLLDSASSMVQLDQVDQIMQITDRFQADTIVIAQDVTLVRESQEAKGHFLGTLSHEVKTPVTSLTMATRLLKRQIDQIPNATHRSLIMTCVDDVERLRVLLEDFLTVSRFDTLTQRLEIQRVDLAKLLRHSVQSFQLDARERGIELVFQSMSPGKPIQAPIDPTKVSWAISNLLTNALRHTPAKGRVDAFVQIFDDCVEIRIRDTGPGIDQKRQPRIFEKFNPFYDIRVARSGGAGMGLAIAREIVVAHGGKIWVTSEPHDGAEFCFTLPLKRTGEGSAEGVGLTQSFHKPEISNDLLKGAARGTTAGS